MTPAVQAARRAGIRFKVIEFEPGAGHGYGEAAASALGVSAEMIYKTLVAKLVPGGRYRKGGVAPRRVI